MLRKVVSIIMLMMLLISAQPLVFAAKFNLGDTVEVFNTGALGLLVRDASAGNIIGKKYDGNRGMILAGPQSASLGGVVYTWWKVRWGDDALEGWSAEGYPSGVDYLKKVYVSPSTKFSVGDFVKVYNTVAYGLVVRTGPPTLSYKGKVFDDTVGKVAGGPFYGVAEGKAGFYYFWEVDYGSISGWSAEDWLTKVVVVGEPVITSSLIIVQSPPYYVGDTITATFTITNKATAPFTFDVLTVGGRDPDDQVADFTWRTGITLNPGESYPYQGTLTLTKIGNYHFFCAYRKPDGGWNTAIPTESGVTNTLDITVTQISPPTPRTWTVDDDLQDYPAADFRKIQDAVNVATAGDTIIVYPGTYIENVDVNKSLTLKSENGAEVTIVQAANTDDHVFEVTTDYVNIIGFTVRGAIGSFGMAGIYLQNANFCNISKSTALDNQRGILLQDSSTNIISDNEIFKNLNAIALSGSSSYNTIAHNNASYNNGDSIVTYYASQNNEIIGNTANSNFIGICIGTNNNRVSNNKAFNNTYGIYNVCANNTKITNNNFSGNYWGIDLWSSNYVTITNNSVNSNKAAGINLRASSAYNTVTKNYISKNRYGVGLENSSNNIFYHNDFVTNTWQACATVGYANVWDDDYPSGGNYWSDYTGVDLKNGPNQDLLGSDGIGDAPYIIDANNRDRYPLMNPVSEIDWWPTFHHDNSRTGYSSSVAPNTGNLLWVSAYIGSIFTSSPAVDNSKVFIGTDAGTDTANRKVVALDENSGNVLWSYWTGYQISSSPAICDGKVFISSMERLYALNENTGTLMWSYILGGGFSSPAFADGKVFIGAYDAEGRVYCFDANTGQVIWKSSPTEGYIWGSPAVADGRVFIGSGRGMMNDKVYAFNEQTGEILWAYTIGDQIISSPSVAYGKVFLASLNRRIYALDEATGNFVWKYETGGIIFQSSPAVAYGKVFIGSDDGKIYALDATTGSFTWSYATGGAIIGSSPAVADGKVFIGSNDGKIYALDQNTGSLTWSYTTGGKIYSSPAIANGKVFVGSEDGKVYAFGPEPVAPPPKFRIGDWVQTTANLNVREGPGLSYTIIDTMPEGTIGQIVGGPVEADGYVWWNVDYVVGVRGWSAENWLELAEELPPMPSQPVNLSPPDGATDVSITPQLLSSPPLQDVDEELIPWEEMDGMWVTRVDSQWQISTIKGDYSNPVWNSTLTNGLIDRRFFPNLPEAWANHVPSGVLDYGTTYYWRVRHRDFRGVWSPWSEETSFTTTKGELYFTHTPKKPVVDEIITFTAPTYGWIVSYEWDFGDGEKGLEQTVNHSYKEAKDYTVTLILTDNKGVTTSLSKIVSVASAWTFAIITDLHIGRGWYDYGADGYRDYYWDGTAHDGNEGGFNCLTDRLADVVTWINDNYEEENIRFLVILGDIADSGEMSEFFRAKRILDDLEIPYFPIIGNHDVWSCTEEKVDDEWKETDKGPRGDLYFNEIFNDEFFGLQFEKLGVTWWDKQKHTTYPYLQNYAFSYGGINFIALDYVDRGISEGLFASAIPETMNWLENCMKNRPEKNVIVFSHYPFYAGGAGPRSTTLTGHLGKTALMYSRNVLTFGGHVHFADNRNFNLINSVYFWETLFGTEYSDVWRPYAIQVSVPVIVTKGMMGGMVKSEIETGKDFLRIVSVEGTYTTANKIDYAKIVELETCDIPEAPAPEKEIVDPAWIQRQWSRIQWATIRSPAELRVYDSHGRVTGIVNGEVRNEIPDSFYFEDYVVVLSAFDSYIYEVVGVEKDPYSLEITSITEMETNTFAAIDILISANAIHQYTVDWDALALGEEGVTILVDSDGDGIFEHTFTSDSELTQREYVVAVNAINTWITDSNFNETESFRAVFTPYRKTGLYNLTATNPGQFYFNILVNNTWPEPLNMTIVYLIDANFVLKGAKPIHVYADLNRTVDITANCTFSDNTITVYNVAPNAIIYITIHLDYALKGTTWTREQIKAWYSEHGFSATVRSITSKVVITDPETMIPSETVYLVFLIVVFPSLFMLFSLLILEKYGPLTIRRRKEN